MFLRSYSYGTFMGVSEIPPEVLNLFEPLVENKKKRVDYASEIVFAALDGKIKLDDSFNIDGYVKAIRKNERLRKSKKHKKIVSFDDSDDLSLDTTSSKGNINSSNVYDYLYIDSIDFVSENNSFYKEDKYDDFIEDDFIKYSIKEIKDINNSFISDYGIDLIFCIKSSLRGIPSAIEELKNVCNDFPYLSDMITSILKSDKEIDLIL